MSMEQLKFAIAMGKMKSRQFYVCKTDKQQTGMIDGLADGAAGGKSSAYPGRSDKWLLPQTMLALVQESVLFQQLQQNV